MCCVSQCTEYYKLLRLGKEGYMQKVENQMAITAYLRDFLRNLTHPNGQKRFQILDGGDVRITANLVPNNKDFFLIVCVH